MRSWYFYSQWIVEPKQSKIIPVRRKNDNLNVHQIFQDHIRSQSKMFGSSKPKFWGLKWDKVDPFPFTRSIWKFPRGGGKWLWLEGIVQSAPSGYRGLFIALEWRKEVQLILAYLSARVKQPPRTILSSYIFVWQWKETIWCPHLCGCHSFVNIDYSDNPSGIIDDL